MHLFLSILYVDKTCFYAFRCFYFAFNAYNIYKKKYCPVNLTYNNTEHIFIIIDLYYLYYH